MSTARYIVGDVFDGLAALEPGSVDLVLTSPPFLALRSYLPSDHPDKAREIGGEPTPGEFIDTLLDVVEACERVLAPHGSMVFELGDTYAGSGGAGGDYSPGGLREGQPEFDGSAYKYRRRPDPTGNGWGPMADRFKGGGPGGEGWPLPKSLCLIPEAFRMSLVYGRNVLHAPLSAQELIDYIDGLLAEGYDVSDALALGRVLAKDRGQPARTTPRWRARNVIRWCRPNPPVGALGDKVRPATSEMVVICKARDRYFDLDAVRTPIAEGTHAEVRDPRSKDQLVGGKLDGRRDGGRGLTHKEGTAGAPPLDWWAIPTEPYKGSHYATWPTDLLVRPIKAMCPQRVCRTCGEPSRRVTASTVDTEADAEYLAARAASRSGERLGMGSTGRRHVEPRRVVPTGEWTDCGHGDWRPGHTLDPFGGSGTTAVVATGHGRDCTLIDIDARNAELARERVGGLFLTVEHLADPDPPATGWGRPVADIATGGAL